MEAIEKKKYSLKFSYIAIILIVSHSFLFKDYWASWDEKGNQFVWDVDNYYSYLPGTFIHHDLTFSYPNKYGMTVAPNGNKVQKGTCGMAIMYMPFFLIGHKIAINTHANIDGYSDSYCYMNHYGTLFYSILAFLFLRSVLARYFTDGVVAITLLCLFFGTNLFYYTLSEGEMTHGYLFFLFSVLIWLIIKWHETQKYTYSIWLGFVMGLAVLIRPTEIVASLIFIFYGVNSVASLKTKSRFLLSQWKHLIVMMLFFCLILSPQIIYWKYITGQYLFFSYGSEEGFFWSDPKIIEVLFSYRKGWLLYTPIMIFSIVGMFFGRKYTPKLSFPIILYFVITLYLISTWWTWWFGGGFGMRALVQSYSFLALPLASFINFIVKLNIKWKLVEVSIKYALITVFCCFIYFNLIQTFEYKKGMIHFDSMTKRTYWMIFGKFDYGKGTENYWGTLKAPDYKKALKGDRK